MSSTDLGPITDDWTAWAVDVVDARTLAAVLGRCEPADLVPWHAELAAAVDELSPLRWSTADPVVALLRAAALAARHDPAATSAAAATLVAVLAQRATCRTAAPSTRSAARSARACGAAARS